MWGERGGGGGEATATMPVQGHRRQLGGACAGGLSGGGRCACAKNPGVSCARWMNQCKMPSSPKGTFLLIECAEHKKRRSAKSEVCMFKRTVGGKHVYGGKNKESSVIMGKGLKQRRGMFQCVDGGSPH